MHNKPSMEGSGGESQALYILVIDDDEPIRDLISYIFQRENHRVSTAANGKEGLAIYSRTPSSFALVILDMEMPELSGDQVFQRIRDINSRQKVLIISGFVEQHKLHAILNQPDVQFLNKPFSAEEIKERAYQMMGLI